MLNILKELNPNIKNKEVVQELKNRGLEDINDYIIFSDVEDRNTFKETYRILKDKNTIILDSQHVLLAQTIDGDYLIGKGKEVLVVDKSLDKNMVETYKGTFIGFLKDYLQGNIKSNILADNE